MSVGLSCSSRRVCKQALFLGCLIALGWGCKKKPDPIVIGRVLIDAPQSFDAAEDARERLRQEVHAVLERSPRLELRLKASSATHFLRVEVGSVVESPALGRLVRPVTVTMQPLKEGTSWMVVGRGPPEDDAIAAALTGFNEGWRVLQKQRQLAVDSGDALLAALDDEDSRLRAFAVEQLGERKVLAAVKPLVEFLKHEDDQALVLRAIGALVSIGDPQAVQPIIELSHRQDPAFVLQVIFAVGSIGGRSAEAYLVTMAGGHPMEPVRKGAEDALAELERQRPANRHAPPPMAQ